MKIQADISNGKFILYNEFPTLAGIEINYTGNIYFSSTLPEGWVLRANKKKVLIFNMGTNQIGHGDTLFTYEGELRIKYCFGGTKEGEKVKIKTPNKRISWNSNKMWGLTEQTNTWESMESKNKSKPKESKRLGRKYTNIDTKGNRPIAKIPMKNNLYTKGKEYMLDGKEYVGYYHTHMDMGHSMTGKVHTKASKFLSQYTEHQKTPVKQTQVAQPTMVKPKTTITQVSGSGSGSGSGGGY